METFSSVAEMHNMQNVHGRYHFSLLAQSVDKSQKENVIKRRQLYWYHHGVPNKKEKGKKIILRKYCWQEPAIKCHRATASALLSSPVILQVTWTLCLDISVFAWCCHKPTYLAIVIFSPRGFPIQMFKYIQGQSVSGKNYGILKLFESRLTSIHLT